MVNIIPAVDGLGQQHPIVEWAEVLRVGTDNDHHAVVEGQRFFRTPQGGKVAKLDDSYFEILQHKTLVRRR